MIFPVLAASVIAATLFATSTLAQVITPNGITNAASYASGFISPGEIVAIFGQGLGPVKLVPLQIDKAGRITTALAGVTVTIDGRLAPLLYVSAGQIGAIVPYGLSSTTPRVTVTYNGVTSPAQGLAATESQPGLFSLDSSGTGQAAAFNQDGSLNGVLNPASRGAVISLYGTGEGNTSPGGIDGQIATTTTPRPVQQVSATIGGFPATVLYAAAAPSLVAGIIQVNLRVPSEAQSGPAIPVILKIGAKSSPKGVTVAIQ